MSNEAAIVDTAEPAVDCHRLDLSRSRPEDAVLLDATERARAARFRFEIHRARYVAAHAGLRRVLGARLGLAPADVRIATTRFGKPILEREAGPAGPVRFNLTHCDDVGWVAVSGHPVGIDVELPRPLPELEPLIASHCTPAERAGLAALPEHARAAGFLAIWTRKEAVLKAWGTGIGAVALDALEVGLEAARIPPLRGSAAHAALQVTTRQVHGAVLTVAIAADTPARIRLHDAD